ncbi:TPA: DUF3265 domain-containing protein [Vibrio vulnificus]|nr:DUF3265 domain-containing protein [Vibrio vulnificus]MDT9658771.1 DUF3265 domain-containing protein [Vibrio vulnificus]HDY7553856.1 DUF3265 domain-containing protein [Vibrio vulnificus]HDY7617419.1 DUF3265 domain-containing protein [Vibrio vulnificus]HDY8169093.1 DUF3265 domain-containing protein [Vibrio vulnificus]
MPNKQFNVIHNAWQFWFALIAVFTVQCSKLIGALFTR